MVESTIGTLWWMEQVNRVGKNFSAQLWGTKSVESISTALLWGLDPKPNGDTGVSISLSSAF